MTKTNEEQPFMLRCPSATKEETIAAADRVEQVVGRYINGDGKAIKRQIEKGLMLEDLAVLVQAARNAAAEPGPGPELAVAMTLTEWQQRLNRAEAEAKHLRSILDRQTEALNKLHKSFEEMATMM
jgi:hypothetical protein